MATNEYIKIYVQDDDDGSWGPTEVRLDDIRRALETHGYDVMITKRWEPKFGDSVQYKDDVVHLYVVVAVSDTHISVMGENMPRAVSYQRSEFKHLFKLV